MMDFDTLRAKYPHLAYAAYAYEPGGPVTLECITADGKTFSFTGDTMTAAIEKGFREEPDTADMENPISEAGGVFD